MISISDDKAISLTLLKTSKYRGFGYCHWRFGPTKDDVTKKTFCDYFEDELVEDQKVLACYQNYRRVYKRPITQINRTRLLFLPNAPCFTIRWGRRQGCGWKKHRFISLPGVPYEMKYLVENEIIPKVVKEYERPYIIHKTIYFGQAKAWFQSGLKPGKTASAILKLAYLPSPEKCTFISAREQARNWNGYRRIRFSEPDY
jgi:nicotinamide-nucleotide amidase